jgi:hypothetical protein
MSEKENMQGKRNRGATIYSGEGYVSDGMSSGSRPRRTVAGNEESVSRSRRKAEEPESAAGRPRRTSAENGYSAEFQEKLIQRKKKRVRHILYGLGGILAVIYIAVAVYFSFHFYSDTSVYGIDCSQKTVSEVRLEIEEKLQDYVLTIEEREDRTEQLTASQIDLEYVEDGGLARMMKAQRAYIWPIMTLLHRTQGEAVAFSYDRDLAVQELNQLSCLDSVMAIAPRDAYIEANDTGFEVIREVMGTTLDREKTEEAVLAALDDGAVRVSLEEEGCYVDPQLYQDDAELLSDAAAMSEAANANITLTFGNETEVVDPARMRDWLVKLSDGSFVIDDVCVTEYVESLAVKYDTFGLPLEFNTSIGTTVTLSGGDYGWCIDQDETVVALLNAIEDGYRGEMEPVYLFSAMSHENQGIGYTYVEICISQQRMWCYQDGNLIVDTPVVTGNPNKGNATPSGGVWAIDTKQRDAILTGEGYTSPVDYWMPFNGNIGIHDMQTRAYFGGTIYLTNGSHGCINTPYDQAQLIYETVSVGTPVIVYD